MGYEFSLTSFFIGVIIMIVGVVLVRYHQWAADNFGSGVSDYDKYKLVALITCGLGMVVAINLHVFILDGVFRMVFPGS